MSHELLTKTKANMQKAIEAFGKEMGRLRTGRASLAILDHVRVEYYGSMVPLNQVATLGVPDPRCITITPYQADIIGDIEKAIEKENLGLTPVNEGKLIRLPIPQLTEERRKDLVKVLKTHAEEARVSVRHVRRDTMDILKKLEKDGEVTEDESKKLADEIQKMTNDFTTQIDGLVQKKEKEMMQV